MKIVMVIMKIDAKVSKIQVAAAVDSLCEFSSIYLQKVRFRGIVGLIAWVQSV
jgi:hypothetical protein